MILKNGNFDLPKGLNRKLDSFPKINSMQKQILLQNCNIITLGKKHYLFSEGDTADSFYLVLKGSLKLIKSTGNVNENAAQNIIVDIVQPGEMIASALMLNEKTFQKFPISASALTPTDVLQASKDFFHSYWKKQQNLMDFSNEQMVKRIQKLQLSLSIQRLSTAKRLAFVLTELIENNSNLRITRSELSDFIGTTTESVIRVLSKWNKDNLISTQDRKIVITSISKLRAIWQNDDE